MMEWAERRRERRRKAEVFNVAKVNGRKMRIWRTVENLWRISRRRRRRMRRNKPSNVRDGTWNNVPSYPHGSIERAHSIFT